jgi:hypothetical protein
VMRVAPPAFEIRQGSPWPIASLRRAT